MVPEQTTALKVVEHLRRAEVHMTLVVDEYGGVLGLLTATDVLEALVGELPAGPGNEQRVVVRPDGSWLIDGSLPVQELKELLKLSNLTGEETDHFQTVAGLIIANLGRIPSEGDRFTSRGHRFEVVDMDRHRVDKVLVVPLGRKKIIRIPQQDQCRTCGALIPPRSASGRRRTLRAESRATSTSRIGHSPW